MAAGFLLVGHRRLLPFASQLRQHFVVELDHLGHVAVVAVVDVALGLFIDLIGVVGTHDVFVSLHLVEELLLGLVQHVVRVEVHCHHRQRGKEITIKHRLRGRGGSRLYIPVTTGLRLSTISGRTLLCPCHYSHLNTMGQGAYGIGATSLPRPLSRGLYSVPGHDVVNSTTKKFQDDITLFASTTQ